MIELADRFSLGRHPLTAIAPTRFKVPVGAWDTHNHVIGASPKFPLVSDRNYTPPVATPSDLVSMLDRVGVSKALVVQVTVHGADHRPLKEALASYPDRLRGIAAISAATTDAELEVLDAAGVVGTRVLAGLGGGVGMRALTPIASRCEALGWHVQIAARANVIAATVDTLAELPVPFVIDHMGWFSPEEGVGGLSFRAIEFLLRNAQCYVKLSGAFRISKLPYPHEDVVPFAQRLVEISPERCFWGSDWPHVGLADSVPIPQVGLLLDSLADYASDAALLQAILVDNPERFYGASPQLRLAAQ